MIVRGKILEWGNSFGIRFNKTDALEAGLLPDTEVIADIKGKLSKGKDIFGLLKKEGRRADTEEILEEIDRDFQEY